MDFSTNFKLTTLKEWDRDIRSKKSGAPSFELTMAWGGGMGLLLMACFSTAGAQLFEPTTSFR
jgi:hypothetical protein